MDTALLWTILLVTAMLNLCNSFLKIWTPLYVVISLNSNDAKLILSLPLYYNTTVMQAHGYALLVSQFRRLDSTSKPSLLQACR